MSRYHAAPWTGPPPVATRTQPRARPAVGSFADKEGGPRRSRPRRDSPRMLHENPPGVVEANQAINA